MSDGPTLEIVRAAVIECDPRHDEVIVGVQSHAGKEWRLKLSIARARNLAAQIVAATVEG